MTKSSRAPPAGGLPPEPVTYCEEDTVFYAVPIMPDHLIKPNCQWSIRMSRPVNEWPIGGLSGLGERLDLNPELAACQDSPCRQPR